MRMRGKKRNTARIYPALHSYPNTPMHTLLTYPFVRARFDWLLFGAVVLIGALFARYVYVHGLLLVMVDQYSHLAIARQVTDSMTPGLSQLGFWPPLVHILMAPATAIDVLFHTGLAAAVILVPILALSAVFLFRLVEMLTHNRVIAIFSTAAYVLNPYMLYYAVTPMSDMLYVALVVIATYYLAHWWHTERLLSLVLLGAVVGMATLARFEGFLLAAVAGGAIMYRLWQRRTSFAHLESTVILYGLLAGIGLVFILIYGWVYGDSPLAFMYNEWSAYAQQRSLFLPTEHNLGVSLQYLLAASKHMLGIPLVVVSMLSAAILLMVLSGRRALFSVIALMLASPFLFDLMALVQGSAVIYVPELPPFDPRFFNERYGLYWLGFAVVMPALLAAYVYERVRSREWYYEPIALFLSAVVMSVTVIGSYTHMDEIVCIGCFDTITNSLQLSPEDHRIATELLRDEYQGGQILMTRALHNEIAVASRIPLRNYILEANYVYFDQALAYPWLFAEWIVMQNANHPDASEWSIENELVLQMWGQDDNILRYYYKVFEGESVTVLRLIPEEVEYFVEQHDIERERVPSLAGREVWNVRETFAYLQERIEAQLSAEQYALDR